MAVEQPAAADPVAAALAEWGQRTRPHLLFWRRYFIAIFDGQPRPDIRTGNWTMPEQQDDAGAGQAIGEIRPLSRRT